MELEGYPYVGACGLLQRLLRGSHLWASTSPFVHCQIGHGHFSPRITGNVMDFVHSGQFSRIALALGIALTLAMMHVPS